MSRPVSIDEQHILGVARELFLERGVGVKTSEVAERAGVSEGSIFNRFTSKAALFHAAMRAGGPPEWLRNAKLRIGRGSLGDELAALSLEALVFFRKIVPLSMMAWSDPGARQHALCGEETPLPVECHQLWVKYFEAEMDLGRMRRVDASVVARTLIGALWSYVMMETFFGAARAQLIPERQFVEQVVELLLNGLAPPEAARERPGKPARARAGKGGRRRVSA